MTSPAPTAGGPPSLNRRLGVFHATMAVIGGIVGAGIFLNPSVVARQMSAPAWILAAWGLGGVVALVGAWIYAELGAERPAAGGQYVFFREAFHPSVAFLYGWGLLWVIQSGGMAAVAVTFAMYARTLTGSTVDSRVIAVTALLSLSLINCFGVRAGATTQSTLTVLKAMAIAGLIAMGLFGNSTEAVTPASATGGAVVPEGNLTLLLGAMVPVLFAYGGWQTAGFLAGEIREPERNLPRAMILGIAAVIGLYLATNLACLRILGSAGLAATQTPASEVMQRTLGNMGSRLIGVGIVVSTLGFLSQGMLTAPRVYFAMARDGLFFSALGKVHAETHVPVAAILLQGIVASIIACTGKYETILNYVVSVDFIFYGLAGVAVFVFRRRPESRPVFRIPWHPWTTLGFTTACWVVVISLVSRQSLDSLIGLGILAAGLPAYLFWHRRTTR